MRSDTPLEEEGDGPERVHRAAITTSSNNRPVRSHLWCLRPGVRSLCDRAIYLLFRSPSSMYEVQYPVGFAVVAFLITVIFILVS